MLWGHPNLPVHTTPCVRARGRGAVGSLHSPLKYRARRPFPQCSFARYHAASGPFGRGREWKGSRVQESCWSPRLKLALPDWANWWLISCPVLLLHSKMPLTLRNDRGVWIVLLLHAPRFV